MVKIAEIIWQIVASIPEGRVATYGQIARLAGYPGYARYVGSLLGKLPDDTGLPWHRVVNVHGQLSLSKGSQSYQLQLSRLMREGVNFDGPKLDLKQYAWRP